MMSTARRLRLALSLALACAAPLQAQSLPRRTIIDPVSCADDPPQSYALCLPSIYTPDRAWSVLVASIRPRAAARWSRSIRRPPNGTAKKAPSRERSNDEAGARQLDEIFGLEAELRDASRHDASLGRLRELLARVARLADAPTESPERSQARRILRTVTGGAAERVDDTGYRRLLEQFVPARR
jgi:hypothetical protein